ncbi:3'(2'), 5'-bisphosphate nucleotidase 1 [Perkinsus olseni]|uniref:3'(2'),5'-bisphosphate nucleotidase 1 n=1 Tax=Perkinsus olseni TaxID=32597 RepID=A0A7J6KVH2_PEROL|nr:3'(2'), 5'-bisphosphate nucleotidase 1 [Perkinsus olseni]KAF4658443.1 3'(2'), 5'-bisphosphate nucleotidase 1 [Perkinsus olseni]
MSSTSEPKETATVDFPHLVSVCVTAAQGAAGIIQDVYDKGSLGLVEKGNGVDAFTGRPMDDPQTEADRRAEAFIMSILKSQVPNLDPMTIIGEESEEGETEASKSEAVGAVRASRGSPVFSESVLSAWPDDLESVPASSLALWVDPLDGTSEFTRGNLGSVTTLIGISVNGRATAGVIVRLVDRETLVGVVGVGVFRTSPGGAMEALSGPDRVKSDIEDGLDICTTRTKSAPVVVAAFENLGPKTRTLKHGGAGRKFLDVLTGVADAYLYPRPGTKRWDSCAGEALLTTLGGNVSDAIGDPIEYNLYRKSTDRLTNGADPEHPYLNGYGLVASIRGPHFHYKVLLPAVYKAVAEHAPQFPLSDDRRPNAAC